MQTKSHSQPSVLEIPDDIWIHILVLSPLTEIMVLRRTCKYLGYVSHLRAVWVNFLHRDVLAKDLPWPSYAWPLASVPTSSLERLVIRAIKVEELWDQRDKATSCHSRCITRPIGSTSWLKLFRSRWLFVGSTDAAINVWDLESLDTLPAIHYASASGYVDSGELWVLDDGATMLAVNTHLSVTIVFSMCLPLFGEPIPEDIDVVNFVFESTFDGFSGILTAVDKIIGFSRHVAYNQPHLVDYRSLNIACLDRSPTTLKAQSCVAMKLLDDLIIVAKDWCVEIFSTAAILGTLSSSLSHSPPFTFDPSCAVEYPEQQMVWRISILDQAWLSNGATSCAPTPITFAVYVQSGATCWTLRGSRGPPEPPEFPEPTCAPGPNAIEPEYAITQEEDAPSVSGGDTLYLGVFQWGRSCRRYIYPDQCVMKVEGGVFRKTPSQLSFRPDLKRNSLWKFPPVDVPDFPRLGQFDEATGVFALAMMSGRIWILDMAHSGVGYEDWGEPEVALSPLIGNLKVLDQEDEGWALVTRLVEGGDPLAAPPGWPSGTPGWYARPRAESVAELESRWHLIPSEDVPDDWSNDWCDHNEIHEWEDYYGCVKSIFNDMFHIPGDPKLLLFHRRGEKQLIEVGGELFILSWEEFEHQLGLICGSPTLNEALSFLRGDLKLALFSWGVGDEAARDVFTKWRDALRAIRLRTEPNGESRRFRGSY